MSATDAFRTEHAALLEHVEHLRIIAADFPSLSPTARADRKEMALGFLRGTLVPHAQAEEEVLYPAIAELFGHPESTATMISDHRAIVSRMDALAEADPDDVPRIQELLYGIHALLVVHFHKEEDDYLPLLEDRPETEVEALLERMGHGAHAHAHAR
jgi:iron-sulfur cluster repair protein YtfE (RIC family)